MPSSRPCSLAVNCPAGHGRNRWLWFGRRRRGPRDGWLRRRRHGIDARSHGGALVVIAHPEPIAFDTAHDRERLVVVDVQRVGRDAFVLAQPCVDRLPGWEIDSVPSTMSGSRSTAPAQAAARIRRSLATRRVWSRRPSRRRRLCRGSTSTVCATTTPSRSRRSLQTCLVCGSQLDAARMNEFVRTRSFAGKVLRWPLGPRH